MYSYHIIDARDVYGSRRPAGRVGSKILYFCVLENIPAYSDPNLNEWMKWERAVGLYHQPNHE